MHTSRADFGRAPRLAALAALTVLALRAGPLAAQGEDRPVREALLAQVVGMGGCLELTTTRRVTFRFFPGVQFIEGTCTLEHGDLARPLVGVDSAGQVYVLDSPSGFQFLTRQHPPVQLDSSTAVQYARTALVMMGKLPAAAQVASNPADVPASLCHSTNLVCTGLFRSHAELRGRTVLVVFLTAFTTHAIYSAGPIIVARPSGYVAGPVQESVAPEGIH